MSASKYAEFFKASLTAKPSAKSEIELFLPDDLEISLSLNPSNKPILHLKFNQNLAITQPKLYGHLIDIFGILDEKHQCDMSNGWDYTIHGNRPVQERLSQLLQLFTDHSEFAASEEAKTQIRKALGAISLDISNCQSKAKLELLAAKRIDKYKDKPQYTFKPNYGPIIEIASLGSELFRFLLGSQRAVKVRSIYDAEGMRLGTMSEKKATAFDASKKATSFDESKKATSSDESKKATSFGASKKATSFGARELEGYAQDEVANMVFENNRSHSGTIGYDSVFWPKASRYAGLDPQKPVKSGFSSIISEQEIFSMPWYQDEKPIYALKKTKYTKKELRDIAADSQFLKAKWETFLKYLLIGDDVYKATVTRFISSEKRQEEYLTYLKERRSDFRAALLNREEFRQFVVDNPQLLSKIKQEFSEFGTNFSSVQKEYDSLLNDVYKKDPHLQFTALWREILQVLACYQLQMQRHDGLIEIYSAIRTHRGQPAITGQEISKICTQREDSTWSKLNFFNRAGGGRDPRVALLYRTIAQLVATISSKYDIHSFEQLLIAQQKKDVLKASDDEIERLENECSFGKDVAREMKIDAYRNLKALIASSSVDETVADILSKIDTTLVSDPKGKAYNNPQTDKHVSIEEALKANRGAGFVTARSEKKLNEFRALPNPKTLFTDLCGSVLTPKPQAVAAP